MSDLIGAIRITNTARERNELGQFTAAVRKGALKAVMAVANLGADIAAEAAPRRSGRLASSVYSRRLGPYTAEVGATAPYAAAQNFGARPHVIGTAGNVMANEEEGFFARGPEGFSLNVRHPGNPATHFMEEGYNVAAAEGEDIILRFMP